MKKLLVLLLVAAMCFSLVACGGGDTGKESTNDNKLQATSGTAQNGNSVPSDQKDPAAESEGLEFELNEAGDAYILVGIGSCKDTDIKIPATYEGLPVTEIGKNAFKGQAGLTGVTVPDSVTTIGGTAFHNCSSLASIALGKGVVTIKSSAFASCTSLTEIAIPESVTTILPGAFARCTGLVSVTISQSVSKISNNVFGNCTALTSVFCEAESQPADWDEGWLGTDTTTVYWGGEWEYVNGAPAPKA